MINASATGNYGNSVYGINCYDTTSSNAVMSFNAVQRTTINVNTYGSTGNSSGILNSGSSYFSVRDSTVFCIGTTGTNIGAYNGSTGYTSIKTSTLSGSTYDCSRSTIGNNTGTLLLNATDLQNANSDGNGFNVGTYPSTVTFGFYNSSGNINGHTYYLVPGTIDLADVNGGPISYPTFYNYFPQNVTIFGINLYSNCDGGTGTISFFNTNTSTPILKSLDFQDGGHTGINNLSTTIKTSESLIVQAKVNFGTNKNNYVTCSLSLY